MASVRASRLLIGTLLLALAGGVLRRAPVAASLSQAAQDQPPAPVFRTEANYVRVDVYPTRNDAPVADLTQDDFEVLDNGTPQKIEQFERVVVRGPVPQAARMEPNTIRESRAMLESARARVFVVFLDTGHVEVAASYNIKKPLIDALDKVIGADDLVGIMTPKMSARDVTFARRTTSIEGMLTRYWYWGDRDKMNPADPVEQEYQSCYPGIGAVGNCSDSDRGVAAEMIKRRREKMTFDALEDLVGFLRGVREERKAVLAITDGWLLYRRNPTLARRLNCSVPTGPVIGVDPRSGKLTTNPAGSPPQSSCDGDRLQLSELDDEEALRRLEDEANRSNTSFYPVDPRGLVAFDTPIVDQTGGGVGPPPPTTPGDVDAAMLRTRLTSLRTLADNTDGLAIVNTNNLALGFKRIVDDLSAYYLIGYYATGKLDGKFHSITVRVKRPGVRVRARRGYLAATEAAAVAARAAAAVGAPSPAATAEARAIEAAIAPLEGYGRQLPIRLQAAAGWNTAGTAAVWAVGELGTGPEWRAGGDADLSLTTADGTALAASRAHIDAGARVFRGLLAPAVSPLTPGEYLIRVRVRSADGTGSASDTLRIALADAPEATGGIFVRRGPITGNREIATADLRFRRSEQLRVELPSPSDAAVTARLLDRTGKPLAVPVAVQGRDEADGSRWQIAQLSLAPLAPGDYAIEIAGAGGRGEVGGAGGTGQAGGAGRAGAGRTLFGFRVIP